MKAKLQKYADTYDSLTDKEKQDYFDLIDRERAVRTRVLKGIKTSKVVFTNSIFIDPRGMLDICLYESLNDRDAKTNIIWSNFTTKDYNEGMTIQQGLIKEVLNLLNSSLKPSHKAEVIFISNIDDKNFHLALEIVCLD